MRRQWQAMGETHTADEVLSQIRAALDHMEGEAQLVGPNMTAAEGGMCGPYICTTGKTGTARLTITTPQTEAVTLEFQIG